MAPCNALVVSQAARISEDTYETCRKPMSSSRPTPPTTSNLEPLRDYHPPPFPSSLSITDILSTDPHPTSSLTASIILVISTCYTDSLPPSPPNHTEIIGFTSSNLDRLRHRHILLIPLPPPDHVDIIDSTTRHVPIVANPQFLHNPVSNMCVRVPWRITCGCDDPSRSTLQQCPKALQQGVEVCKGVKETPVLGDEPCQKCIDIVTASYLRRTSGGAYDARSQAQSDAQSNDGDQETLGSSQAEIQVVGEDGVARSMEPGEVAVYEEEIQWSGDTQVHLRVTVMKAAGRVGKRERILQLWRRICC